MGPVIAMMYLSVSGDILKSILTELSPSENTGLEGSERESDWPKATQLSVSGAEVMLLLWLHPASCFGVMGLREAPSWQVSVCLHFDVMIVGWPELCPGPPLEERTPQEPSIWPAACRSPAEWAWNTLWKLLFRLCSGTAGTPHPIW